MRLVYTADLHGQLAWYRDLLAFAVEADAAAVVVGGDLLPRAITREDSLAVQRAFVEQELRPLFRAFHARYPAIALYLLPGNDDWAAAVTTLNALEAEELTWPLHERIYTLAPDVWLAGYACVPLTPFSIKDYESPDEGVAPLFNAGLAYTSWSGEIRPLSATEFAARPSIADDLARLAQRSDPARTIYVCHTPPADTPLDVTGRSKHVGSRALRAFIEHHQPPLTLHGHIHEAPQMTGQWAVQLGRTWCVNPGHDEIRFHAVAFDSADVPGTLEHTIFGRIQ